MISPEEYLKLVVTMPKRIAAVIQAKGVLPNIEKIIKTFFSINFVVSFLFNIKILSDN